MLAEPFFSLMMLLGSCNAITYEFKGVVFDAYGQEHFLDFKISSWVDGRGYAWIGEKGKFPDSAFIWYEDRGHTPGGAIGSADQTRTFHLKRGMLTLYRHHDDKRNGIPPMLWFRFFHWKAGPKP